jgi:hypothetical protein
MAVWLIGYLHHVMIQETDILEIVAVVNYGCG